MPPRNPELYGEDGYPTEESLLLAIQVVNDRQQGQLVPPEACDIIAHFADHGHPAALAALGMENTN